MSLKDVAVNMSPDPEKPSITEQTAYFNSLVSELKELGFEEPMKNAPRILHNRIHSRNFSSDFKESSSLSRQRVLASICLLGETDGHPLGSIRTGELLDIFLRASSDGDVTISLEKDRGSLKFDFASEGHLQSHTFLFEHGWADSPANVKKQEFKWSEHRQAELAIVTWAYQNAAAPVPQNLRPAAEVPRADLHGSAKNIPS